jgi:hypothetical protein
VFDRRLTANIGVIPDPDCPRDAFGYHAGAFYASPYPRPIPGVPIADNLHGASLAVANMTGLVARALTNRSLLSIFSLKDEPERGNEAIRH